MIDILDNAIQLSVSFGCALWAYILALRHKSQTYFMVASFYGTFALGLLYWLLYLLVNNYMSKIFYVSELSWIASYLFLLMLCQTLPGEEERAYHPALAWAIPLLTVGVILYLVQTGEIFANIAMCSLLGICGWFATRGFLWARRQSQNSKEKQVLYASILLLIILEYGLWIISCKWLGYSLKNPYYWFDFCITGVLPLPMLAMRRMVKL